MPLNSRVLSTAPETVWNWRYTTELQLQVVVHSHETGWSYNEGIRHGCAGQGLAARRPKGERKKTAHEGGSQSNAHPNGNGLTRGLKRGPFGILVFWLVVMGVLYLAMNQYLQPKPLVVSASGDLIIPRARDGHFRLGGSDLSTG